MARADAERRRRDVTIFFPDVSHYQAGLSLDGAPAVIAKATEGTGYTDASYENFKAQAATMGVPFLAYHFLRHGDVHGQVVHAEAVVGKGQPLMLDVETAVDGSVCTLNDTLDFMAMWPGMVSLVYIPEWFWRDKWSSPDLTPIADHGAGLISSYYVAYSETGPGWHPYGGMAPVIWQYTSSHPFNGQRVDFNAYKGSVDQLRAVFNGGTVTTPEQDAAAVWAYPVSSTSLGKTAPAGDWIKTPVANERLLKDGTFGLAALRERLDDIDAKLTALAIAAAAEHTHTVTVTGAGGTGPAQPLDPTP